MATKYIVDNLNNQFITGNLTINGNLSVTGTSTSSLSTYRALLSQTGSLIGTDISNFGYQFLIGERYIILNYVSGDDFSNIANVLNGNINETGCEFIATGATPNNWDNGSELQSSGDFVVTEIENTLGYNLVWEWAPFGGGGYYVAYNAITGPFYNAFPKTKVQIFTQTTYPFDAPIVHNINAGVVSFTSLNDVIIIDTIDLDTLSETDNLLNYTPVKIEIQQDMTPIILSGDVVSSYPFNYVSVGFQCDGDFVTSIYGGSGEVNNITEVVNQLNSDSNTNQLGVYSESIDGRVLLTTTTNNANLLCSNGTLTFTIFAD